MSHAVANRRFGGSSWRAPASWEIRTTTCNLLSMAQRGGRCWSLFIPVLFDGLSAHKKKELWGVIMILQGSSLGFSHPTPCSGHRGCWKVLCTPAGVSEHDQGAEDHKSGAVEAAQPFRGQVCMRKIPFQTWLRGSIWALGPAVSKARTESDSGLEEKGMFAICFSSSFPRKGGGIHLPFVHVGSCFIVFCFVFPPTLQ